jgi:hypothetical protein
MGKESIGGQLSEEAVVGVLKQIVRFTWTGTHLDIFRDMKSRFEDENVKDEIKEIKKEMENFYNKTCNDPRSLIYKKRIELTIAACYIIIVDKEPPNKRPEETLENICSDVVTRGAPNRAGAIIEDNGHIHIASGVIVDD